MHKVLCGGAVSERDMHGDGNTDMRGMLDQHILCKCWKSDGMHGLHNIVR